MADKSKRRRPWLLLGISAAILACCATVWQLFLYDDHSAFSRLKRFEPWEDEAGAISEQIEALGAEVVSNMNFVEVSIRPTWRGGETGLRLLAQLGKLEELTLEGPRIDDDSIRVVAAHLSLSALHLKDTSVTASGVQELAEMDSLLVLELDGIDLSDEDLAFLAGLGVKWLLIDGSPKITDAALVHLKGLADKLVYLRIAEAKVTGKGLSDLDEMANVRALLLPGCPVDNAGLGSLKAPNLACLDLSGTRVSGAALGHLNGMPKLRELNLDNTPIDDETLPHLAQLKSLEVLSLNGTPITDAGLVHLQKLQNLKVLGVERTKVSRAAIEELKRAVELQTVLSEQED